MRNANNRWPPEPKVAGSNLAWRTKNQRKAPAQPCAKTHENSWARGAGHTDKRHGITGDAAPSTAVRPRRPNHYHTPAGDVWSWAWIAVTLASALALVALTGCDCRDLERGPFVLRKSHCHPGQDWDWVLLAGRNGAHVCRCPGGAK